MYDHIRHNLLCATTGQSRSKIKFYDYFIILFDQKCTCKLGNRNFIMHYGIIFRYRFTCGIKTMVRIIIIFWHKVVQTSLVVYAIAYGKSFKVSHHAAGSILMRSSITCNSCSERDLIC